MKTKDSPDHEWHQLDLKIPILYRVYQFLFIRIEKTFEMLDCERTDFNAQFRSLEWEIKQLPFGSKVYDIALYPCYSAPPEDERACGVHLRIRARCWRLLYCWKMKRLNR